MFLTGSGEEVKRDIETHLPAECYDFAATTENKQGFTISIRWSSDAFSPREIIFDGSRNDITLNLTPVDEKERRVFESSIDFSYREYAKVYYRQASTKQQQQQTLKLNSESIQMRRDIQEDVVADEDQHTIEVNSAMQDIGCIHLHRVDKSSSNGEVPQGCLAYYENRLLMRVESPIGIASLLKLRSRLKKGKPTWFVAGEVSLNPCFKPNLIWTVSFYRRVGTRQETGGHEATTATTTSLIISPPPPTHSK